MSLGDDCNFYVKDVSLFTDFLLSVSSCAYILRRHLLPIKTSVYSPERIRYCDVNVVLIKLGGSGVHT